MRKSINNQFNDSESVFSSEVVLVEPEIPQNTGNIVRTCAALGCSLHLIEPLGFSLEDKYLKRAGLDYWPMVDFKSYPDLDTFFSSHSKGKYYFFSKKADRGFHEVQYQGHVYFFFGKETWGLPEVLMEKYKSQCLRIPMQTNARSLNLSNSVAIVLYEAYRQNGFPGLQIASSTQSNINIDNVQCTDLVM